MSAKCIPDYAVARVNGQGDIGIRYEKAVNNVLAERLKSYNAMMQALASKKTGKEA